MYLDKEPILFHTLYEIKLAIEDDPKSHNHPYIFKLNGDHIRICLLPILKIKRMYFGKEPILVHTLYEIKLAIEDDPSLIMTLLPRG